MSAQANKKDYVVFILTYGRPNSILTINMLESMNYRGDYFLVCSTDDPTLLEYMEKFGDKVIVFDKDEIKKEFDSMDNFGEKRGVVYPRNACWDIAKERGYSHFVALDDDYSSITYRANDKLEYTYTEKLTDINFLIENLIEYLDSANLDCVAIAQTGDYIGGKRSAILNTMRRRKIMNFFVCATDRRFNFLGTLNEDVNVYVSLQQRGFVFMTHPLFCLKQRATQKGKGGLTDTYKKLGTYMKSFYSVMCSPSAVNIFMLRVGGVNSRLHHKISWKKAVPYIISDEWKK